MPKLIDLISKEVKDCELDVEGEVVHIAYRPKAVTSGLFIEWMGWKDLSMAARESWTVAMIVALVASWDILDDAGAPLPITAENVKALPTAVNDALLGAIMADMFPNPPSGETSSAKSKRRATQAK